MAPGVGSAENPQPIPASRKKHVPDRILVPVDGSPAALRALALAGRRKKDSGRDLAILVLNVQASLPPSRYVSAATIRDHYMRMAKLSLASARTGARRLKLEAAFYSRRGDPAPTIARFARKMDCGEIIMGTRGRGRMASFVLGSVALRVIQLASVPVTLVK
jgi:nucleotide-binding universal stress UspA family protein